MGKKQNILTFVLALGCASASAVSPSTVDFSKIRTWIGDENATLRTAAVISWNDGENKGLDNMVVGFRFNEGDEMTAEEIIPKLIASDARFYSVADVQGSLCFDNGGEGELFNSDYFQYDHRGLPTESLQWKINGYDGLKENAVFQLSLTAGEVAEPEYLFYLPEADRAGLWLLDGASGHLSDSLLALPVYYNVCGGKLYSYYNTNNELVSAINCRNTIDGKTTGASRRINTISWPDVEEAVKGRSLVNLKFGTAALSSTGTLESERLGNVEITTRFQYIPKGEKKQKYCNYCDTTNFEVLAPEIPATDFSLDPVTIGFRQSKVNYEVKVVPENATYLGPIKAVMDKVDGKSVGSVSVSGRNVQLSSYDTEVENVNVKVTSTDYPSLSCDWSVAIKLVNPVTKITVPVGEDGYIHIPAYMESEYMFNAQPSGTVIEPANPDIPDIKLVITEGPGSASEGGTALVTNHYQKGDKSNDLTSRAFADVAALDKYTADVAEDPANLLTCTAHYEAADGSGVCSNDFKVVIDPRDRTPLADEYQDGTFWLNEDWFGHANSSINYITADREIKYRVYESQNPDMAFGCTSQYGMIYGGRLYIMSKQEKDNGDRKRNGGGRVVVADAKTLKRITSFDEIGTNAGTAGSGGSVGGKMQGDGRACVGVRPDKIYLGHHKGIRVMNIDLEKAASEDPETAASAFTLGNEIFIEGADLDQGLYEGQIGDMICVGPYVYAVSQADGLLVIDAETDKIVDKLGQRFETSPGNYKYSVQGVLQSADGYVWFAENDTRNTADIKTYFNKVDPATGKVVETLQLPEGAGSVNTGWGAWRSANFFASRTDNVIYWGNVGSGYMDAVLGSGTGYIFRWEIGTPLPEKPWFELGQRPGMNETTFQHPYATMRYDDRTNEILMCTTHGASYNYRHEWIYFIDGTTGEINDCQKLRTYFWFPAIPIFPDKYEPEFINLEGLELGSSEPFVIDLYKHVDDRDNNIHSINFSIVNRPEAENNYELPFSYSLDKGILTITPNPEITTGTGVIPIMAESNGKTVTLDLPVKQNIITGINEIATLPSLSYASGVLRVKGLEGHRVHVYDVSGRPAAEFIIPSNDYRRQIEVASGLYFVKIEGEDLNTKIIVK